MFVIAYFFTLLDPRTCDLPRVFALLDLHVPEHLELIDTSTLKPTFLYISLSHSIFDAPDYQPLLFYSKSSHLRKILQTFEIRAERDGSKFRFN